MAKIEVSTHSKCQNELSVKYHQTTLLAAIYQLDIIKVRLVTWYEIDSLLTKIDAPLQFANTIQKRNKMTFKSECHCKPLGNWNVINLEASKKVTGGVISF